MLKHRGIQETAEIKKNSKKRFLLPFIIFLCLGFAISCEKDFSANADSEPFPIVYGLLDVSDTVHYIKVFKSYLVEGNAYDVVKDVHKYSYLDSIDVYLVEYNAKGDFLRNIPFDMTTDIPKDSGLFGFPTQIIYKSTASLGNDSLYKLVVYNKYTKIQVESKEPVALAYKANIREPATQVNIGIPEKGKEFRFFTGRNATRYFLQIKYYYTEDYIDGTSRQPEPIIWELGELVDNSGTAAQEKTLLVGAGSDFFRRLQSEIKPNDKVRIRHTDSLIYEIYSAAKDFDLYMRSSIPSTGINQEQLYYSNLKCYNTETGEEQYVIGFFSSRTKVVKWYRDLLWPGTRDSLFYGRLTGHLKFSDNY